MRILIADDHALLRKGLIQVLADELPDAQFGETSTMPETMEALARAPWDVLVLDIFMPGRSGLEALHEVRRSHLGLPVLVLSSAPDEQLAVRVLKAGASGYLNKQAAPEELVSAIRKVAAGRRYVSAEIAELLAAEVGRTGRKHELLSDREFAVLQLLLAGRSIEQIAEELSLSAETVSTFHVRLWEKLGVQNDVELYRYGVEHGLVSKAPPSE